MSSHRGRREPHSWLNCIASLVSKATCKPQTFFMKKQERIDAAKKRIQELKTLIKYWNNGTSKTSS